MPIIALRRIALTLMELLVVIAIIGVLVGLLLPAVQKVRSSAATTTCQNNIRQIALALHQYHDADSCFPPGVSWLDGRAQYLSMSWLTRLLPFLEQSALWQQSTKAYAADTFFETPPHFPILGRAMPLFSCPADSRAANAWDFGPFSVGFTSYLGVEGVNQRTADGVLYCDSAVSISAISDGTSNTLMIGERPPSSDQTLGWWYAGWGQSKDGSAEMLLGAREIIVAPRYLGCPASSNQFGPGRENWVCDTFHFWSFHTGGANFAFADGSVHLLSYWVNPVLPALATRDGGEVLPALD